MTQASGIIHPGTGYFPWVATRFTRCKRCKSISKYWFSSFFCEHTQNICCPVFLFMYNFFVKPSCCSLSSHRPFFVKLGKTLLRSGPFGVFLCERGKGIYLLLHTRLLLPAGCVTWPARVHNLPAERLKLWWLRPIFHRSPFPRNHCSLLTEYNETRTKKFFKCLMFTFILKMPSWSIVKR